MQERGIPTEKLKAIAISAFLLFAPCAFDDAAAAAGLWGPPQTVSREAGGIHTGIGYMFHADQYENDRGHAVRQKQVYSHLGYGARNWEIYGRIGVADLKISDAFLPTQVSTSTSKNDFQDNWKFLGILGAKAFYPFNRTCGIGAFMQGSYFFSDFADRVSGAQNGVPFTMELKVKNFWDLNFGVGFQAMVPNDIKMYLGPYIHYSEAKIAPSQNIPGLALSAKNSRIKNKTLSGGFAGIDVPLGRGFHLNIQGQYSERVSVGAAVTYSY